MAFKANLVIDQGADYTTNINVTDDNDTPTDLTGWTGIAEIRKYYTSNTFYSFNVSTATGYVTLSMNAATTSTITPGRYVYDCQLTNLSGVKSRLVEGIVTITPSVSH